MLKLNPEESLGRVWITEQHPDHRPHAKDADIAEPDMTGFIYEKFANVATLTKSQQSWDAKHV